MSSVEVDLENIDDLFERAFTQTMKAFGHEIREAFSEEAWEWPNVTRRRNGQLVGSPRNVIDTGALRNSQTEPVVKGDTAYIEWTAGHAVKVFTGVTDRSRKTHPARNVPQMVGDRFNFAETFLKEAKFL